MRRRLSFITVNLQTYVFKKYISVLILAEILSGGIPGEGEEWLLIFNVMHTK